MPPHLRVARATDHLEEVLRFYRDGLAFSVVGEFRDHDGFDGVMLGLDGADYHLEFTRGRDSAGRAPGVENLLVLYLAEADVYTAAVARMTSAGHPPVPSHNPYWDRHGKTFEDVDGYRVVIFHGSWKNTPVAPHA